MYSYHINVSLHNFCRKEKLSELRQWLKSQPHTTAERRPSGSKLLTDEAMQEIEKRILNSDLNKILTREIVEVQPTSLYIVSYYKYYFTYVC